ncbi:hypothetical protein N665_0048s0005 [Sinapis alba]|nr:hypothetical protein N665_0048s0005 [Sinapis alba]
MARCFLAEYKGKAVAGNSMAPLRIRIRAPDFDPSELIKENMLTLVGRLTNLREQETSSVIPYLAMKWNMEPSSVSNLGRDCFQFRFARGEDICEVLSNKPY